MKQEAYERRSHQRWLLTYYVRFIVILYMRRRFHLVKEFSYNSWSYFKRKFRVGLNKLKTAANMVFDLDYERDPERYDRLTEMLAANKITVYDEQLYDNSDETRRVIMLFDTFTEA